MDVSQSALVTLAKAARRIKEIREAERLEDSFYEFVKAAWKVFDPADFVGNWHLEDLCDHLEAVARGYAPRLLVNVPPRTAKTNITSICFPAWVWAQREKGPLMGPQVSFFYASYAERLALEHSLKCRRLIESRWYQKYWGARFKLMSDRNTASHFENDKGGYRMASSVDARATGYGADILCLPPGEKVLTDCGWLAIDDIVLNQRSVKVAGYDHDKKRLVWQDILEYERNPGRELVRITFDGGSFRCTADHPVFVDGVGYVQAVTVKAGQILRTVPGMRHEAGPQPNEPDMRRLSEQAAYRRQYEALRSLRQSDLRNSGAPRARKWPVLLARMFGQGRNGATESPLGGRQGDAALQEMQEGISSRPGAGGEADVLQLFMQGQGILGRARSQATSKLRRMRATFQARTRQAESCTAVLLQSMQRSRSRQGNAGEGQSTLRSRRLASTIRTWLDKVAQVIGAGAGWLSVPRLRLAGIGAWDGATRPPYQLRQERYGDEQSDFGMPGLSRSDAREKSGTEAVETAVVRSVEPAGHADTTFNLNVSPCHNYFVGGALVHNCADDPHLVKEAESELVREGVVRWWSETMPSRLNNRQTGAMIVVMQRVHEGDLAGHILANDLGYLHFCVPMSYVPCRHVNAWNGDLLKTVIGDEVDDVDEESIFWVDRRTEDGQLLWSERFPASEVAKIEKELGPYAYAGQFQQEPAPRGGGIIRREWWQPWDKETAEENGCVPEKYPGFEYILAAVDGALTEKEENDPSAMTIWGIWRDPNGNPNIFLMYAWAERYQIHDLARRIGEDCKQFKVDRVIIENKASGHSIGQELVRLFGPSEFGVELVDPRTGFIRSPDKVARLQSVVYLFSEGLVFAPDKSWADAVINQCATVPRSVHDDLADTVSLALLYLRRSNLIMRREETAIELEDETRYVPRSAALYPA